MDYFSLLLPFSYLTILILSLATFSHLYRRRKALQTAKLEPWFPEHTTRNIYLTLLEQASAGKSDSKEKGGSIPDSLLRAALLQRSTTNIRRLVQLRGQKPALTSLQQRGSIGDDLVQRFNFAEKEMEAELRDCVAEANALCPPGNNGVQGQGWGQSLFQSAGEIVNQENVRAGIAIIEKEREQERLNWVNKRKAVREGFLKEVGAEEKAAGVKKETSRPNTGKTSEGSDDAVVVESPNAQAMERQTSVGSSGDGSAAGDVSTPGAGGGGGKKKKKNNKKKN